ncbi:hypothetical protein [Agrococcus sp. ARC_14]|uniref:hypothetical protein n=1 Tax=Agrococcus sp. ARC_14 TaxID=2919927 RepID=UPI001F05381C|nr:hypothetical protein [Agrococcus sp. ARC_14]MCH1884329.1 hypothetical protein [Agrococcus sp. ARC_14]
MSDADPTATSMPTPAPGTGPSRRTVLLGAAGAAATALIADVSGLAQGITGGGAPAQAAGQPVEPRHGAGEWTEEPEQSGLSQSSTAVIGDIAALPLDRSL